MDAGAEYARQRRTAPPTPTSTTKTAPISGGVEVLCVLQRPRVDATRGPLIPVHRLVVSGVRLFATPF